MSDICGKYDFATTVKAWPQEHASKNMEPDIFWFLIASFGFNWHKNMRPGCSGDIIQDQLALLNITWHYLEVLGIIWHYFTLFGELMNE